MDGYLLDTNIVSETRRQRAHRGVLNFLEAQDSSALFISVLTLGELRKGVGAKRRRDPATADLLAVWIDGMESTFSDRVLAMDARIARLWGELSASGAVPVVDTLIAATAIIHGLTLVTRNTEDVRATGAVILDPWA